MLYPIEHWAFDMARELLWCYCRECCRERDVEPATIPLPPEFPVPEVGSRMKCSACGSRAVETKPELYPGGISAPAVVRIAGWVATQEFMRIGAMFSRDVMLYRSGLR